MSLWGGRVGRPLDPAVSEFLRARRRGAAPLRLRGDGDPRPPSARGGHPRRRRARGGRSGGSPRSPVGLSDSGPEDEDVHSRDRAAARRGRAEDPRRAVAQRPGGGCVPALRRGRVRGGAGGDRRARRPPCSTGPRPTPRRRCPATRTCSARSPSPSATTCSRGWRCSSATCAASPRRGRGGRDSPLGAGALAGSTLPLPPPERQLRNSLDAVADRDFALDYLYAAALCFVHLSRIGEELVLWTTAEFGFAVARPRRRRPARR